MADQEPTELMILLKIVEVLGHRLLRDERSAHEEAAVSHVANVVNNFIASSPNLAFAHVDGDIKMGDNYTTGQAGAVGPRAHAHDMTFNQVWNQLSTTVDLPKLKEELSALRQALKGAASEPEHDIAIAEVANAEIAAKEGDGGRVLEHLRKAGQWVLAVATNIGATLAANVITKALGM
jgi:hypothetical protein